MGERQDRIRKARRRKKLVQEGHRLLDLMFPKNKLQHNWLKKYMKGVGDYYYHFTYMDDYEAMWAVALLKNRAWRKGIETPPAQIL